MAKVKTLLGVAAALFLAGCAGQYPPSGGPVDKSAPRVVETSPTQKQLNFSSREITVTFDKYMSHRSVESATYFPPFSAKELAFDWSGKDFVIQVKARMREDQTYILTIGAPALDLRNNSLGKSFNLVFSTGAHIDTGSVTGQVYAEKKQPYTIAAYPATADIDTLRPYLALPQFVTQSDDSGSYILQGLADGRYRLVCFDDQMRNFTYAPQSDMYASATNDVTISPQSKTVSGVDFIPSTEDTTGPQLYSGELTKDRSILLKFSEPIDSASVKPEYFIVHDSASGKRVPVSFAARLESEQEEVALRVAGGIPRGRTYSINAGDSVRDLQFNRLSLLGDTVSVMTDSGATQLPDYFFNFKDSLTGVMTYDTIFCQVSPSIVSNPILKSQISFADSNGALHPELLSRISAGLYRVVASGLNSMEWYSLKLSYQYSSGDSVKDSTVTRHFKTVDFSTLGEVDGKIMNPPAGKKLIVAAVGRNGKTFYSVAMEDGTFTLSGIPAADYSIRAYVQHPPGMLYYRGRSFPYRFAYPFGVFPQVVRVRARWTSEGVTITLH